MISICINVDTRKSTLSTGGLGSGITSLDMLTHGIKNKIKFFDGQDVEIIVYVDVHELVPKEIEDELKTICDTLVLKRHDDRHPKWNCLNFLGAISECRGEYIVHIDGDMALFRHPESKIIDTFKDWLDTERFRYICFPTFASPLPDRGVDTDTFSYRWVSTRFFMCKRHTPNITEIKKCLDDSDYLIKTYFSGVGRWCGWLEHVLGMMEDSVKVYYPPLEMDRYMIFCWHVYRQGLFEKLNNLSFDGVLDYVNFSGGIMSVNGMTVSAGIYEDSIYR